MCKLIDSVNLTEEVFRVGSVQIIEKNKKN